LYLSIGVSSFSLLLLPLRVLVSEPVTCVELSRGINIALFSVVRFSVEIDRNIIKPHMGLSRYFSHMKVET
jgi:hypothetical protein